MTARQLINTVGEQFGITGSELRSGHALPRQVAMYVLRDRLGYSYPRIGRLFAKDHSTAMHAVVVVERMRKANKPNVVNALAAIERRLSSTEACSCGGRLIREEIDRIGDQLKALARGA